MYQVLPIFAFDGSLELRAPVRVSDVVSHGDTGHQVTFFASYSKTRSFE